VQRRLGEVGHRPQTDGAVVAPEAIQRPSGEISTVWTHPSCPISR